MREREREREQHWKSSSSPFDLTHMSSTYACHYSIYICENCYKPSKIGCVVGLEHTNTTFVPQLWGNQVVLVVKKK